MTSTRKRRDPITVAMSLGDTTIVSTERKSEGKIVRLKLFEMLVAEDRKDLSVEEQERLSHFLRLTNNIIALLSAEDES